MAADAAPQTASRASEPPRFVSQVMSPNSAILTRSVCGRASQRRRLPPAVRASRDGEIGLCRPTWVVADSVPVLAIRSMQKPPPIPDCWVRARTGAVSTLPVGRQTGSRTAAELVWVSASREDRVARQGRTCRGCLLRRGWGILDCRRNHSEHGLEMARRRRVEHRRRPLGVAGVEGSMSQTRDTSRACRGRPLTPASRHIQPQRQSSFWLPLGRQSGTVV